MAQSDVLGLLRSNLYLTEGGRLRERAKQVTRRGQYTYIEYCRFADDLAILFDAYPPARLAAHGGDKTPARGTGRTPSHHQYGNGGASAGRGGGDGGRTTGSDSSSPTESIVPSSSG